jgi:hypothetical protein
MVAVYKGTLKLDRVTGARPDGKSFTPVKFKKSTDLPVGTRAMKTSANVTRDGLKK